jgi:hypothetical protein
MGVLLGSSSNPQQGPDVATLQPQQRSEPTKGHDPTGG